MPELVKMFEHVTDCISEVALNFLNLCKSKLQYNRHYVAKESILNNLSGFSTTNHNIYAID